jgi:GT2 family glycosyltransferase
LKYKYLFFIPSPRDIPLFKQTVKEILYPKFDVLWLKYYPEIEAYRKARQFFLESDKKYDYFVILPDDLIVNRDGLDILINEIENSGRFYPVLSGICNFSCIKHQSTRTVSAKIVIPDIIKDKKTLIPFLDHFITFQELDFLKDDIFQVLFNGFSCEFIHRNVLEAIEFQTEVIPRGGIDTYFSFDLEKYGIPQYIHKQARFLHLKGFMNSEINSERILTGEKPPVTIFHDSHIS